MAKIVAHKGFNSNTLLNDMAGLLLKGGVEPGYSPTGFVVDDGFREWKATGVGITYQGALVAIPNGGTIKAVDVTHSLNPANKYYTATGLDFDIAAARLNPVAEAGAILSGKDTLLGSIFDDSLYGFRGNDTIKGNGGKDLVNGGLGRDIMTGGDRGDRFQLSAANESGKTATSRDIVTDFKHGTDKFDFTAIDANGAAGRGRPAFDLLVKNAHFSGKGAELRWFQEDLPRGSRTILEADINGDKKADFQIELKGLITLGDVDFV